MSKNGKTLKDYREVYDEMGERTRKLAQTARQLHQDFERLIAEIQLATVSYKKLRRKLASPLFLWAILPALLGGLLGGAVAAIIALLLSV